MDEERVSVARNAIRRGLWVTSTLDIAVVAIVVVLVSGAGRGDAASLALSKRGVVTITMTTVGDPGNPSVGVVQTFGGPKGQFVDPPENTGTTGIYKSCSDAPSSAPSCLTVGGVSYTYGIGEFDVTVSQYVTFLNTVDPRGEEPARPLHRRHEPHGLAAVRLDQIHADRRLRASTTPSPIRSGRTSHSTSGTSDAMPASSIP